MSSKTKSPPVPSHLRPETKAWFRSVISEYQLEQHHLRLLQLAAEAWDSAQLARAAIAIHGQTFVDMHGCPRARPEVGIERDARIAYARLLRELDLDVGSPADAARPPALRSNSRGVKFYAG
jgi:hypothetical protein